jgi:hypothetical protein
MTTRYREIGACENCGTEGVPVATAETGVTHPLKRSVWEVCEPCGEMPPSMADSSQGRALAVCTNLILREIRLEGWVRLLTAAPSSAQAGTKDLTAEAGARDVRQDDRARRSAPRGRMDYDTVIALMAAALYRDMGEERIPDEDLGMAEAIRKARRLWTEVLKQQ